MSKLLKRGLKFKRLRPGPCCSPSLIEQIKIDPSIPELKGLSQLPLIENRCGFYDKDTSSCKLQSSKGKKQKHDSRPTMCRLFPVWPDLVSNDFDWFLRGPSITHHSYQPHVIEGLIRPGDESLSIEDVGRKLMHYVSVHSGDELDEVTYETADELLSSHVHTQEVLSFLSEFSLSTKQLVFEDEDIVVIDTPIESPESITTSTIVDQSPLFIRSMMFKSRPHLIQSSVVLQLQSALQPEEHPLGTSSSNSHTVTHLQCNELHGPHHQGLALSIPYYLANASISSSLASSKCDSSHSHSINHVLVLGAGGCALPLFLSSITRDQTSDRLIGQVTAVEASGSVVSAAQRYFLPSAQETNEGERSDTEFCRMSLVHACAQSFVSEKAQLSSSSKVVDKLLDGGVDKDIFDIIIVDIEDGSVVTTQELLVGNSEASVDRILNINRTNKSSKENDKNEVLYNSSNGSYSGESALIAPPHWCLNDEFLAQCSQVLNQRKSSDGDVHGKGGGGLLVMNVIGNDVGVNHVGERLKRHFPTVYRSSHLNDSSLNTRKEVVFFATQNNMEISISACISSNSAMDTRSSSLDCDGDSSIAHPSIISKFRDALDSITPPIFSNDKDTSDWLQNLRKVS